MTSCYRVRSNRAGHDDIVLSCEECHSANGGVCKTPGPQPHSLMQQGLELRRANSTTIVKNSHSCFCSASCSPASQCGARSATAPFNLIARPPRDNHWCRRESGLNRVCSSLAATSWSVPVYVRLCPTAAPAPSTGLCSTRMPYISVANVSPVPWVQEKNDEPGALTNTLALGN